MRPRARADDRPVRRLLVRRRRRPSTPARIRPTVRITMRTSRGREADVGHAVPGVKPRPSDFARA